MRFSLDGVVRMLTHGGSALDQQPELAMPIPCTSGRFWAARILNNSDAEAHLDKLFQETR